MELQTLWFILIAVLFCGFFLLEGFDFGVGILLPFLGRSDSERRVLLNTIGPFWDGNEVWLITAAGALFAAFPLWYATLLSGFYLLFILMLLALIVRGAAFEFRSKRPSLRWRQAWDWAASVSSLLPGFLWGVIIANSVAGVPIDHSLRYTGTPWQLFSPYAIISGLAFTLMFTLHGAIFLSLRTEGALMARALAFARFCWLPTVALAALFVGWGYMVSSVFAGALTDLRLLPLAGGALALLLTGWQLSRGRSGWAFVLTSLTILLTAVAIGLGLFPRVMISSLNPSWSLTVANTASSPYTLTVMSWLALSLIPFVLLSQAWNYWIFRKRISSHVLGHY